MTIVTKGTLVTKGAAARKAAEIFRDYVADLYYQVHRMTWQSRLRCMPFLLAVEYLVYQVDAVTEGAQDVDLDAVRNDDYATLHRYKAKFEALLRHMHAYNWSVAEQLEMGEQYVRLENKVTSRGTASHAEVMRLAELRPSDVRLLHGMIFALRRQPCDRALLDLLWPVEVLADIGNDLSHYGNDLTSGRFNTYAAFVRLYGREAPARLRAEIARYEQLFRTELANFPAARRAELGMLCGRRYRNQTATIPEVITQDDGAGATPRETS